MTELVNALPSESEPEIEQAQPVETPEADTLDQPTEETPKEDKPVEEPKPTRSQERIQQLTQKVKSAEAEVEYWKNLNKQPEVLPVEESEDGVTVDQIANAVLNKQAEAKAKEDREAAAEAMKADVAATIEVYPELDADDDLAAIVVSVAEKQKISIRAAADKVMGLVSKEKETAEKRTLASQALRSGVASPQGSPVGNGTEPPLDISRMSEEEKEANWERILAAHN